MRKIVYVFVLFAVMISCKNQEENNTETEDQAEETLKDGETNIIAGKPLINGEFIRTEDGAVLKGESFIYGVHMDDIGRELAKRVEPIKKDEFDMVPVTVQGKIAKNPVVTTGGEGWPEIIIIENIVKVSDTPSKEDIRIEDKKN
ncbi:hypothetical protein [Constantimarinum furrinae]|uniref:Uncharacterized protein n=1 Tax=Constantimarinum furrinae TaxID=2562285 RepID=A0A7G8PSM3_9FLAO|nr:hypothetical protein [Constantimarinum furrinae]QNJ97339.1 hypothetical protein ALE3EI_0763 [Constantimarinum furrinae]